MGWTLLMAAALTGAVACGNHDQPDPVPVSLTITPEDLTLTVVNGAAVAQDYTVMVTDSNGKTEDVTEFAQLTLRDKNLGTFTGPSLLVDGQGAGPTRVFAYLENLVGETGLTVMVKKTIVDDGLPPNTPDVFDTATEDAALAPKIEYPNDKILVPPNLGRFDVHWSTATSNVFQMRMFNAFIDIRRYTTGRQPNDSTPFWTAFEPQEWYPIASTKQQLTLQLSGMNSADTTKKGTATPQLVDVTNENTRGGIYYWATTPGSNNAAIMRYDVETPAVPPSRLFPAGQEPGGAGTCVGCHALSKDGTKIAMTLTGGNGRGTVVNVANRAITVPVADGTRWNFATFTPDASKLLTVYGGVMSIRDVNGGTVLGTLPNSPGVRGASHPEVSPDGGLLANTEYTGGYEAEATGCSLVVRTFDPVTNAAGPIKQLVAAGANSQHSYYPSFSPDSKWIAFTRATSSVSSYNQATAETWVMKSDGSSPPIKLASADLGQAGKVNSWARWVPFALTYGPTNEQMFYLTFSSFRKFGVRLPNGGRPQIWMTPFFPARAEAGMDPTGPAFRVPFQDILTGNHIAQWTQAIVVIE